MSYAIGGAPLEKISLTYSWGLSPGSGSATVVGTSGFSADTAIALSLGGVNFYGVISSPIETQQDGTKEDISLLDNRVWLMRDVVFGSFNVPEVVEDNPLTPGIDRYRRYAHILPSDWLAQKKTWTSVPLSAEQILDYLFEADTVAFTWERSYHALQSHFVHEIDASTGKKLGNIIQEISEAQGLVFTLNGENTLQWARKGDGSVPSAPSGSSNIQSGTAINQNDTLIQVVGDRNKYQLEIDLEPDWEYTWQQFWAETDWLGEVDSIFGPYDSTQAGQAALAAKSREVTVRDYVNITGNSDFADYRKWGEGICRMEIPAWLYLRDIVFKAYRIPPDFSLNGTPLLSLEFGGLLQAMNANPDGTFTLKSPPEYYPDGKAAILVQGVQCELLDPKTQGLITSDQIDNMTTLWSPNNKFTLDEKNYLIIFEGATFLPGTADTALFLFPNDGISGIGNDDPLHNIIVPNADVVISPANVRAIFCLAAEKYISTPTGSGERRGTHYISGLEKHIIYFSDSSQVEIPYLNNKTADQHAALYLAAITGQQAIYAHGGYTRHGAAGTALTPTIDRVTVSLNFQEALTERVEFTKERLPAVFMGERELERRQRSTDLFPGQRELRIEAKQLRIIALLAGKRTIRSHYQDANAVMQTAVGAANSSIQTFSDTNNWPAGTPVFFDTTGAVANDGKIFGGITIADNATGKSIAVATDGIVPVRIQGPFNSGDSIGIDDGEGQTAYVGGSKFIGTVNATFSGSDIVVAPVRLGAGAGTRQTPWAPTMSSSGGSDSITLYPAKLCGLPPDNIFDSISVPDSSSSPQWVCAHATTDGKTVNNVTIEVVDTAPELTVTRSTAGTSFSVPVAVVFKSKVYQIEFDNLEYLPEVAFTESVAPPSAGAEPFVRWYRWVRQ